MILHVHMPRLRLMLASLAAILVVLVLVFLIRWPGRDLPLPPEPRLTRDLRATCRLLLRQPLEASPRTRESMSWACGHVGVLLPWPRENGCGRAVTYAPGDILEQNLLRYAVLFGFQRLLSTEALVEPEVLDTLQKVFPGLTLPPLPPSSASERWQTVSLWSALELVRCRPGELPGDSEPRRYLVDGRPDGNALQLFHPFVKELLRELRFSGSLRRRADSALLAARGHRTSATFISLLLPAPDSRQRPVSDLFLKRSLDHYRRRFFDALFVVVAADSTVLPPPLLSDDVVRMEPGVAQDPALSLAVCAACNHSIVTGDEGFWGAYLAGGNMTVPQPETSDAQGFGWLFFHSQIGMDERWAVVS